MGLGRGSKRSKEVCREGEEGRREQWLGCVGGQRPHLHSKLTFPGSSTLNHMALLLADCPELEVVYLLLCRQAN